MKINWKTLSLAMITSIIITGILWLALSLSNVILAYPDVYEYYQSLSSYISKFAMTIAQTGNEPPFILHLWTIILLFLVCFAILTIVFYFIIGHLQKRKK